MQARLLSTTPTSRLLLCGRHIDMAVIFGVLLILLSLSSSTSIVNYKPDFDRRPGSPASFHDRDERTSSIPLSIPGVVFELSHNNDNCDAHSAEPREITREQYVGLWYEASFFESHKHDLQKARIRISDLSKAMLSTPGLAHQIICNFLLEISKTTKVVDANARYTSPRDSTIVAKGGLPRQLLETLSDPSPPIVLIAFVVFMASTAALYGLVQESEERLQTSVISILFAWLLGHVPTGIYSGDWLGMLLHLPLGFSAAVSIVWIRAFISREKPPVAHLSEDAHSRDISDKDHYTSNISSLKI